MVQRRLCKLTSIGFSTAAQIIKKLDRIGVKIQLKVSIFIKVHKYYDSKAYQLNTKVYKYIYIFILLLLHTKNAKLYSFKENIYFVLTNIMKCN